MFYEYLDSLCAERGLTVTELMKKLNLNPSSASRWKSKGYLPSRAAAKQIADFFGITVSELLSGGETETKTPVTNKDDELDDEMIEMLEEVRRNPELKALFSISTKATPDDIRKTIAIMKTIKGDGDGGSHT